MSATPVPVTVLSLIGPDETHLVDQVVEQVRAQRDVDARLVLVDCTRTGIAAVPGATIVRSPSWGEGAALQAAAALVDTEWVAWWDACSFALPTRLARTVEFLEANPGADMALTAYFVSETGDRYLAQVDPAAMGGQLAPWWTSGVVHRAALLASLEPAVGFPARLALFQELAAAGRVAMLSTPLFHVPSQAYIPAQLHAHRDMQFLDRTRSHVEAAGITAVVVVDRDDQPYEAVLTAIARQHLPGEAVATLVVDRTGPGSLETRLSGVAMRGALEVVRIASGSWTTALNQAMRSVKTPLVAVFSADTVPEADGLLEHLRAHQQLTSAPAAVLGEINAHGTDRALDRVVDQLQQRRNQDRVPGQLHSGSALRLDNVSLPVDTLRAVGGFDERFAHPEGADQDLGIRLEAMGVRVFFQPRATASRHAPWTMAALARPELSRAAAMVPLLDAHPDHLGARIDPRLDRQSCETQLAQVQDDVERSLRAAEAMAGIDLTALEQGFEGDQQLAVEIAALLNGHVNGLVRAWALAGTADGFRRQGIGSFTELLSRHPVRLEGARSRVVMGAPSSADEIGWRTALSLFLDRHTAEEDITLALLALDVHASTLMRALREESQRLRLHQNREPASVLIVSCDLPESQWLRLLGAADAWVPLGHAREALFAELACQADLPVVPAATLFASGEPSNRAPVPYPLDVHTPITLLAWPDWQDVAELTRMWDLVRPLVGRRDITLCLRLDLAVDGDPATALGNLQQTFADKLGQDSNLTVLIVDEELDAESAASLTSSVDAGLVLSGGVRDLVGNVATQLSTPGAVSRWVVRIDQTDVPPTTNVLAHVG